MYYYELKSTGASSSKFGPCEVCGEYASEVFLQTEQQTYELDELDIQEGVTSNLTTYGCKDYFGHKECLLKIRR